MRPPPTREESRLPRYLTSFVGREREITEITDLLTRDDVRLLTLLGPGGAGKTRLAVEVASQVDGDAFDAIWFVSLVAVQDPALVLPSLGQALGLQQAGGFSTAEAIAHFLRDKRALLVIDNFEHLADAALELGKILTACPAVTILTTSRVALRISGEYVFILQPLEIPQPDRYPLNRLADIASVRLFLERASAAGSKIGLSENNSADIVDICRRLDGLPLAVELAAALGGILSPAALLSLLRQQSGILAGGPRDAHERHRSMHDAIAWSYNLLPEQEQAVFRRLAVFDGGISLQAAESVVDLPIDVLDAITSLARKSLVVPICSEDDAARFTMLETLREFGQERLEESGESGETRDRHAAWFLDIAEASDFAWFMPLEEGLAHIRRLRLEQGNVRAALAWLRRSGDFATCLHMASQLGTLWVVLGNSVEGQRWLEGLLQEPHLDDDLLRAKGLAVLSWISNQHGHDMRAFELAEKGLAIYRSHAVPIGIIQCLILSGVAASRMQHLVETAIARHREAIDLMKVLHQPAWINNSIAGELSQLGQITLLNGDLDAAETLFREAWDYVSGNDDSFLYLNGLLLWAAHLSRARGDEASALRYYQQTLDLARRGFHVKACATSIAGIAGSLSGLGDLTTAARLFGATEALHETSGVPFVAETFDIQRALGLPEPWAREDEPCGSAELLRHALQPRSIPRIPKTITIETLERMWEEGRTLALETAVQEALEASLEPSRAAVGTHAHGLSSRQLDVLRLVAEGRSNRAIADALSLSERTVEHHVTHILTRLDLDSRTAAATFAVRHGLL